MSAALPMALRVRFQEYLAEGLSGRAAEAFSCDGRSLAA